jgi:hypothetical protein
MANKKITELTELTSPAGADLFAIVDDTDTTTKKVTVTNLMTQAPVQTADISSFITGLTAGELGDFDFDDNAILGFSASKNDQTGTTYTVAASDNGKVVVLNNASAITVDIDTGLPAGFNCSFVQKGAGQVSFAGTATVNNRQSHTKINGQYGVASIVAYDTDTYILAGDTAS